MIILASKVTLLKSFCTCILVFSFPNHNMREIALNVYLVERELHSTKRNFSIVNNTFFLAFLKNLVLPVLCELDLTALCLRCLSDLVCGAFVLLRNGTALSPFCLTNPYK